jgi:FkbM family methyltransferase
MKISSQMARQLCRAISPPARAARWFLGLLEPYIQTPPLPALVSARGGFAQFEIYDTSEHIQNNIFYLGYWEWYVSKLLKRLLLPGDTFVDVGANMGWFTLLGAHLVGPTGRVIAFEPNPVTRKHLERNVRLNLCRHVIVESRALSDRSGTARLRQVSQGNAGSFSIVGEVATDDEVYEISTARFDDYHGERQLGRIRVMKIDVEGAELLVLKGMQSVLRQHLCDFILVETTEWQLRGTGASIVDFLSLFEANGYECATVGAFGTTRIGDHRNLRSATLFAGVQASK